MTTLRVAKKIVLTIGITQDIITLTLMMKRMKRPSIMLMMAGTTTRTTTMGCIIKKKKRTISIKMGLIYIQKHIETYLVVMLMEGEGKTIFIGDNQRHHLQTRED